MTLAGLFFLLLFSGWASSQNSYRDVINYLNLTKNKELSTMSQPVKDPNYPMTVQLDVLLYAILDVQEKEQQFVAYIWVDLGWKDEFISWDDTELSDIKSVTIPAKTVWTPDLTIAEMTEKDKAAQSPYLAIYSNGMVWLRNDMVVVSSCKMQVFKFPFDTQKCNLTFKSVIHSDRQMMLKQLSSEKGIEMWSLEMMKTQSEWIFKNMTHIEETVDNFGVNQSMIVYTNNLQIKMRDQRASSITHYEDVAERWRCLYEDIPITMQRRSVLYIVNFILPIVLFLFLDLASFLISDSGGEKLSFKVTVLLAVTVMQLILNEILPSTSEKIPLIAMYCIGTFGLMMLSLLETILVMYLMEKDSASKNRETDKGRSLNEDCDEKTDEGKFRNCLRDVQLISCSPVCSRSSGETSSELLHVPKEGSSSQLKEESYEFEKEVLKSLALLLSNKKEEEKPGYWTRMTKTINRVFLFFYIITVIVFLTYMFNGWNFAEE